MHIDLYNTVVTEESWPGSVGDSCAETARLHNLAAYLGLNLVLNLDVFITPAGYVRHPTSPWREDDFTADQYTPLRIARPALTPKSVKMLNLPVLALMLNWRPFLAFTVWVQAQLFKLPYRWNDGSHSFQRMELSSADYLNWFQLALLLPSARNWVPRQVLEAKIRAYYAPEPDVQWLLDIYLAAIDKYYTAV